MGASLAHQSATRRPNKIVSIQNVQMCRVQCKSKDKWAKYEPVLMSLADSTAVARQVKTLTCSKLSALKTACLALTKGNW